MSYRLLDGGGLKSCMLGMFQGCCFFSIIWKAFMFQVFLPCSLSVRVFYSVGVLREICRLFGAVPHTQVHLQRHFIWWTKQAEEAAALCVWCENKSATVVWFIYFLLKKKLFFFLTFLYPSACRWIHWSVLCIYRITVTLILVLTEQWIIRCSSFKKSDCMFWLRAGYRWQ